MTVHSGRCNYLPLSRVPAQEHPALTAFLESLPHGADLTRLQREALLIAFFCSPFIKKICQQQPMLLQDVWGDGVEWLEPPAMLNAVQDESAFMLQLRNYRNRAMALLAIRDILGIDALEATLSGVTRVAESSLCVALEWLQQQAAIRYGFNWGDPDSPRPLLVLGMGKMGAWELNFSSDIDLVFISVQEGVLPDRRSTSYAELYARMARGLVRLLDTPTPEGFVFRVDTRLRPYGESGPLVVSQEAFELYCQTQARPWERYAMVKARVLTGAVEDRERIERFILPFVYRRYLDYRALGELRGLKSKISDELRRKGRGDNVKLGYGGIREIEFIVQSFQLVRGGQLRQLQDRRLQCVLARLPELTLMSPETVVILQSAYRFLRLVENRLQQYADQQTHELPLTSAEQQCLAFSLGFDHWADFMQHLDGHRHAVSQVFSEVIVGESADLDEHVAPAVLEASVALMSNVTDELEQFRKSRAILSLSTRAATDMERVISHIIQGLVVSDPVAPECAFRRLLPLLQSIAQRGVYLTLLAEYPAVLQQLMRLAAASPWLVRQLTEMPELLDELLDPRLLYQPLSRADLQQALDLQLASIVNFEDEDLFIRCLRRFKGAEVLRVAAADIMGVLPLMVVSDYLTDIAETIVNAVLRRAWRVTAQKHGVPSGAALQDASGGGFGIIAYGKFGGIELGYGSDLDLVFLYQGRPSSENTTGVKAVSCTEFYGRVARRVVALLSVPSLSGPLYEVDLRLRPSGNSGLLVSSLDAYRAYQMDQAWTWELQALVRARCIGGDPRVAEAFSQIRRAALCRQRSAKDLRVDVVGMREKMRASLDASTAVLFDLKQGAGGIADIEFIVQFSVLANAACFPDLVLWSDVVRLLALISDFGLLGQNDAQQLREAYCCFRAKGHHLVLQDRSVMVPADEMQDFRQSVQRIWHAVMIAPELPV